MSTVDHDADGLVVHTRDAPETVLPCCTRMRGPQGSAGLLEAAARVPLQATLDHDSARGLRVLAIARRTLDQGQPAPVDRAQVESELELIGLVGMVDPPRPGVADAVARAYRPGIRIPVVTGDYGPTAAEIARQVGIGHTGSRIVTADELDRPRRRAARRGVRRRPGDRVRPHLRGGEAAHLRGTAGPRADRRDDRGRGERRPALRHAERKNRIT